MLLWTLAWRYLWRNKRRTIITLTAIVVGVWAMIFMLALMRGMIQGIVDDGIRLLPGHIGAHHKMFLDDPNIVNSIHSLSSDEIALLHKNGISSWTQRLKIPAVISSERETRGITLWGVNPTRESQYYFNTKDIVAGSFFDIGGNNAKATSNKEGIVVGEKLLEKLKTQLGRRVVIMSQDPDNQLADRGVRIMGVFRSSSPGIEDERVYISLEKLQSILNVKGLVSEISINSKNYRNVTPEKILLHDVLQTRQEGISIKSWGEINRYLGNMLPVMDGFVIVWVLVVFMAMSFGLVNTLAMAVFERVREIGLMQALGVRPRLIVFQVVCEAFILMFLGLIMGNILAALSVLPFKQGWDVSSVSEGMSMMGAGSKIYPLLLQEDVLISNGIVIVLGLLASFIPAWRASRYTPIVALNMQ